jgi:hypothetical protein
MLLIVIDTGHVAEPLVAVETVLYMLQCTGLLGRRDICTYNGSVGCCMTEHDDVLLAFVETVHAVVNVVVVEIRMLFCCRLLRK